MKIFSVIFLCAIFLLTFSKVAAAESGSFEEKAQAVKLLNKVRAEVGLKGLAWHSNSNLQAAAEVRAKELEELFSHTRPDGSSCFTVFEEFNINYRTCAENIAYGTRLSAEGATELWRNSPGHYKNMTNANVKEVGLASWHDNNGNVYWVQLFKG
mgnify:CR=1 FL=1